MKYLIVCSTMDEARELADKFIKMLESSGYHNPTSQYPSSIVTQNQSDRPVSSIEVLRPNYQYTFTDRSNEHKLSKGFNGTILGRMSMEDAIRAFHLPDNDYSVACGRGMLKVLGL